MVKIALTGISTSNGHNFRMKKILDIRWCQNSRLFIHSFMKVSSCHLFTLLRALSVRKVTKKSVYQVWLSVALWPKRCPWDLPPRRRKIVYCHITFIACGSNFCGAISRSTRTSKNTSGFRPVVRCPQQNFTQPLIILFQTLS